MAVTLYASALTARDTVLASLGRGRAREEGDDDLIMASVNYATAEMERITGRRLAARDYTSATRLRIDGDGDHYLRLSEYPVNTVTSAASVDENGVETALDLTGKRLLNDSGRVFLPWQTVPEGVGNILVTCNAGYASTDPARYDLERICLRLSAVIYQDLKKQAGRVTDATLLSATSRIPDFEMPADIANGLKAYARMW
jgi:uncharacterized phiE125 gp8 family phage protein